MATSILEDSAVRSSTSPSQRLRTTMAAVRVSLSWLGTRKTLTADQKALAADAFGAEGAFLSAGKKLLDTKHPAFKAVTAIKGSIGAFWKSLSLPYPEPGIRLIRQDKIDSFNAQMRDFQEELDEAVWQLDEHYAELRSAARDRLGSLYDPLDYPESLRGMFQVTWDFPSVEPPDYLQQLNPELYRQECERVSARFDEAVRLAEQAFAGGVAAVGRPPDGTPGGASRWKAQSVPGLRREQPDGVLRSFQAIERPQQRGPRRPGPAVPGNCQRRRSPDPARQSGSPPARGHQSGPSSECAG